MTQSHIKYSVVVPIYNEEDSVTTLYEEVTAVMKKIGEPYELLTVNDCSDDQTLPILQRIDSEEPGILKIVTLTERTGQTLGMRKGIDTARGEFIITMDADLQNDPADIPRLIEKMAEGGYDMVCGWRKDRHDTWLKARLSKFGNLLQRTFTGMKIHDISCTLRLFKREVGPKIALNWEGQHRFIPLSISLQGYNVGEIVSNHRDREFGYSKYTHGRIFRVMVDFFRVLKAGGKK